MMDRLLYWFLTRGPITKVALITSLVMAVVVMCWCCALTLIAQLGYGTKPSEARATIITVVITPEPATAKPAGTPMAVLTDTPGLPPADWPTDTLVPAATPEPTGTVPSSTRTPSPTDMSEPVPTDTPTDTPAPTDTVVPPTNTPAPSDTPESQAPDIAGFLPGLQPADVYANLEERDFTCTRDMDEPYFIWSCTLDTLDRMIRADIYARTLDTVDLVETSVLDLGAPDDDFAVAFLGYMATVPYDGAKPNRARAWVEETLPGITQPGDSRTKKFGGVEFVLVGPPGARTLYIGSLE